MIRKISLLVLAMSTFSMTACTGLGLVTGAAAVTGVSAAQEGGLSRAYNDAKIKIWVNEAWFQYDIEAFQKLSTTINQGRILITGVVQNPDHRVEAVRLAWQVKGVSQVINEIRVAESKGITGFVKDSWITSRLRGSLTWNRGVQSINYSIDTVQGVVYLMGVAQNQEELNRVIETARTISGVKQVVSYVKLAGEPLKNAAPKEGGWNDKTAPQNLHDSTTNTNLKTREMTTDNVITDDVDVPARSVPEDQPSIEDQYYN
jgi:osmotically-inducible protein OsmY